VATLKDMTRLVIIGAIATGTSQTLVQAALVRGWQVSVITAPQDNLSRAFPAAVEVIATPADEVGILHMLRQRYGEQKLLLTSTNDKYALLAARVAAALGLDGPNVQAIEASASKALQKRILQEAQLLSPGFTAFRLGLTQQALDAMLAPLRYPLVIKPAEGISSLGVRLCQDVFAVHEHVALLACDHAGERRISMSDGVLAEEFLVGPEYCVELFDGVYVGTLRKLKRAGESFIERGYSSELDLEPQVREALIDAAERATRTAGLGWGPVHLDCIVHRSLPHIIDINPRIAGSFICELVKDAYGFDLVEALLAKLERRATPCPMYREPQAYARVDFLLDSDPASWTCTQASSLQNQYLSLRMAPQNLAARERRAYVYFKLSASNSVVIA
jgi:predicted ATP-grasp superfamily ATP-dependent carboligase